MHPSPPILLLLCGALLALACDPPQCVDPPVVPPDTSSCAAPPGAADPQIASAGAQRRDDGVLVLTWSSWPQACGVSADQVDLGVDCERTGWVVTVEVPPELAVPGTIDLDAHPEVLGSMAVFEGGSRGATGSLGGEPFFTGALELTEVAEGCVTGALHGFGTAEPTPSLEGPALAGSFQAPTC